MVASSNKARKSVADQSAEIARLEVLNFAAQFGADALRPGRASSSSPVTPAAIVGDVRYNVLIGTSGNDLLEGTNGNDEIYGLAGNDTIRTLLGDNLVRPGAGRDFVVGGDGFDIVDYSDLAFGIQVTVGDQKAGVSELVAPDTVGRLMKKDTLVYVERIAGTTFADLMLGSDNADQLYGTAGNDFISGGLGDDIIDVGDGTPTLYRKSISRPDIVKAADRVADSFASAITIDTSEGGDFDTDRDENITQYFNRDNPQLVPHATVKATASGTIDFYKIELKAGQVDFEIDGNLTADGALLPLELDLRSSSGESLKTYNGLQDGSAAVEYIDFYDQGDPAYNGLQGRNNPRLIAKIATAGIYYLTVSTPLSESNSRNVPTGGTYTLNISDRNASTTQAEGYTQGYSILYGGYYFTPDGGLGSIDAGSDTVSFASVKTGVTVDMRSTDVQQTGGAGQVQLFQFDNITGSYFADTLRGTDGVNIMLGGDGDDQLFGRGDDDTLRGGNGADRLSGGEGFDQLYGDDGDDVVLAGEGNDILDGGTGNDMLYGGRGADQLFGRGGDDVLDGGSTGELVPVDRPAVRKSADMDTGALARAVVLDTRSGGNFDIAADEGLVDRNTPHARISAVISEGRADFPASNLKYDYYAFDTLADAVVSIDVGFGESPDGERQNLFFAIVDASGNIVADPITGKTYEQSNIVTSDYYYKLDNAILPSAGRYYLQVAYKAVSGPLGRTPSGTTYSALISVSTAVADQKPSFDLLDGGTGSDTASYALASAGVTVDLGAGDAVQTTGGGGSDKLVSIENLAGSKFADTLKGNAGANILTGGGGADLLTGGAGADVFRYLAASDSAPGATDIIADFQKGVDTLDLSAMRTGRADRFKIATEGANTFVNVDLGGNGTIDARIQLNGKASIGSGDVLWASPEMPAAGGASLRGGMNAVLV